MECFSRYLPTRLEGGEQLLDAGVRDELDKLLTPSLDHPEAQLGADVTLDQLNLLPPLGHHQRDAQGLLGLPLGVSQHPVHDFTTVDVEGVI